MAILVTVNVGKVYGWVTVNIDTVGGKGSVE